MNKKEHKTGLLTAVDAAMMKTNDSSATDINITISQNGSTGNLYTPYTLAQISHRCTIDLFCNCWCDSDTKIYTKVIKSSLEKFTEIIHSISTFSAMSRPYVKQRSFSSP